MQKALDISKHQSCFNAATAKSQGISTTICRCAYATGKDICWDTFAPAVQAAGMQLGARLLFLSMETANLKGLPKQPQKLFPRACISPPGHGWMNCLCIQHTNARGNH